MNRLTRIKKHTFTARFWRFIVSAAALISILMLAQPVLAQVKTTDLTLYLRNSQNNYSNVVKAGQDNKFFLEVRNIGTERINNIQFSSDVSGDWIVDPYAFQFGLP